MFVKIYLRDVGNNTADVPTADVADKLPMQEYKAVITRVEAVVLDQYKEKPAVPAIIRPITEIIEF